MTHQRTAIVSGGTRGIGLAFSRRLVRLGYSVVALYRRDDAAAEHAAKELGPAFRTVRTDLADGAAVAASAAEILSTHGAPAVLINNAGVNVDRPFLEMTHDDWHRVIDSNLSGVFYLTRAVAPAMLAADAGAVIVNIGATTGIRPRVNGANYCASKAGLLQLTKCLALEFAPKVRVNCLIPGVIETEEVVERLNLDNEEAHERVLAEIPQRRIGDCEDLAEALEFLIGPGSAYMTGQRLIVDGGQFMW
ncbi:MULTISPECIES: SDR family NAD(P)-dependent oxidoreductase [Streptomyces]|uniref:SDR family NAD(P)-dependent oxidoreductase n=1 Tax=Streptomyces TaxID=1883 RepID=UPI00163C0C92|nr:MULTISPECIES: SDR family oxidoreductase [Streptomyces]MBC2875377.1 SDR family oxidoreductase [Streptomyces sp. TYQ1024]UBI35622.1 SDR family oxidoreductase [Streptomyces mobaraensis]UKW28217.1 SDR family oxidoreductase [Streptomyces sp. TYQ1024]